MDIRYSTNPKDFKRYTTRETRDEFLIEELFRPNGLIAVYSHVDRMVTLGCMPAGEAVAIDKGIDVRRVFGSKFFLENREIGIFNVGGVGEIVADDETFKMSYKDCLYIGRGVKDVSFKSADAAFPAKFYMCSSPAHRACPTKHITLESAAKKPMGAPESANKRVINQFIHPNVLETSQLLMGLTELDSGNVWNSMPTHTHERRMEVYMYFEVPDDQAVFHLMGEGGETRHIVMKNFQAVISPSWSIHAGCGTSRYSFIWAMCGENKEFEDMNVIKIPDLK
jgi:4-deoxy-L-threo-5-hexosulose-uronate ketol-isomerase